MRGLSPIPARLAHGARHGPRERRGSLTERSKSVEVSPYGDRGRGDERHTHDAFASLSRIISPTDTCRRRASRTRSRATGSDTHTDSFRVRPFGWIVRGRAISSELTSGVSRSGGYPPGDYPKNRRRFPPGRAAGSFEMTSLRSSILCASTSAFASAASLFTRSSSSAVSS